MDEFEKARDAQFPWPKLETEYHAMEEQKNRRVGANWARGYFKAENKTKHYYGNELGKLQDEIDKKDDDLKMAIAVMEKCMCAPFNGSKDAPATLILRVLKKLTPHLYKKTKGEVDD